MDIKNENFIKIECIDEYADNDGFNPQIIDGACKTEPDNQKTVGLNSDLKRSESVDEVPHSDISLPLTKGQFTCDKCPYTTTRRYNFNKHTVIHQDVKERSTYSCKLCKFVTIHKNNLTSHLLTHKRNSTEALTCKECSYQAKNNYSLRRHGRVHRYKALKAELQK